MILYFCRTEINFYISAENDFKGIDKNIDLIVTSDIVKDKQNSDNMEKSTTTTTTIDFTPELKPQNEYNSLKIKR